MCDAELVELWRNPDSKIYQSAATLTHNETDPSSCMESDGARNSLFPRMRNYILETVKAINYFIGRALAVHV